MNLCFAKLPNHLSEKKQGLEVYIVKNKEDKGGGKWYKSGNYIFRPIIYLNGDEAFQKESFHPQISKPKEETFITLKCLLFRR